LVPLAARSVSIPPVIVDEIFAGLEQLKKEGRTIVLVEQNTYKALSVADHVYLMQTGKIIMSQKAGDVDIDRLHDLYFARDSGASE
jgi:branched-chain amino acid transport system ATP-binding protein